MSQVRQLDDLDAFGPPVYDVALVIHQIKSVIEQLAATEHSDHAAAAIELLNHLQTQFKNLFSKAQAQSFQMQAMMASAAMTPPASPSGRKRSRADIVPSSRCFPPPSPLSMGGVAKSPLSGAPGASPGGGLRFFDDDAASAVVVKTEPQSKARSQSGAGSKELLGLQPHKDVRCYVLKLIAIWMLGFLTRTQSQPFESPRGRRSSGVVREVLDFVQT